MSKLDDFLKLIPGSSGDLKDLDPYLDNRGDIKALYNIDVLIRSIINLLLTARGTYVFDPEYGCDLYRFIFEPADEITKQDIYMELERSLRRYENRGSTTYEVVFFSNKKGFRVDITIEYKGDKKAATITIDESLLRTMKGQ